MLLFFSLNSCPVASSSYSKLVTNLPHKKEKTQQDADFSQHENKTNSIKQSVPGRDLARAEFATIKLLQWLSLSLKFRPKTFVAFRK